MEVRSDPGAPAADPLFVRLFIFAASVNFFPATLGGAPAEAVIVGAFHLPFIYRVRVAQRAAATARAADLRMFLLLREGRGPAEQDTPGRRPTE